MLGPLLEFSNEGQSTVWYNVKTIGFNYDIKNNFQTIKESSSLADIDYT